MAKFCGKIGFVKNVKSETQPGVWKAETIEKTYYGDVTRDNRRWQNGIGLNNDIVLSNVFSIVIDNFALENYQFARYIEYMGTSWSIQSAEVAYPRLIINAGGVYNGDKV